MVETQGNGRRSNVFQIIKKSGDAVLFDEMKLQHSVEKALLTTGIEKHPIASQLVDDIIKKLEEELSYRENITTLDISEAVEISLLERGLTNVASTYHDFGDSDNSVISSDSSVSVNPAMSQLADLIAEETPLAESIGNKKPEVKKSKVIDSNTDKQELPDERSSFTYRFTLEDCNGYITVSLFEDGSPGEIVLYSVKSVENRNIDVVYLFLSVVNTSLQYGVPISDVVDEILSQELAGNDFSIKLISSICEWLHKKFQQ